MTPAALLFFLQVSLSDDPPKPVRVLFYAWNSSKNRSPFSRFFCRNTYTSFDHFPNLLTYCPYERLVPCFSLYSRISSSNRSKGEDFSFFFFILFRAKRSSLLFPHQIQSLLLDLSVLKQLPQFRQTFSYVLLIQSLLRIFRHISVHSRRFTSLDHTFNFFEFHSVQPPLQVSRI